LVLPPSSAVRSFQHRLLRAKEDRRCGARGRAGQRTAAPCPWACVSWLSDSPRRSSSAPLSFLLSSPSAFRVSATRRRSSRSARHAVGGARRRPFLLQQPRSGLRPRPRSLSHLVAAALSRTRQNGPPRIFASPTSSPTAAAHRPPPTPHLVAFLLDLALPRPAFLHLRRSPLHRRSGPLCGMPPRHSALRSLRFPRALKPEVRVATALLSFLLRPTDAYDRFCASRRGRSVSARPPCARLASLVGEEIGLRPLRKSALRGTGSQGAVLRCRLHTALCAPARLCLLYVLRLGWRSIETGRTCASGGQET